MNATDKKFREDLEGHEVKPSDAVWERVEAALPEQEEKKAVVLWYRWAAAAAILLIFGLGWMSRDWTGNAPVQDQIAAKPTEQLEEAQENESKNQGEEEKPGTEQQASEPLKDVLVPSEVGSPLRKAEVQPQRVHEELILLPQAGVNLASVDFSVEQLKPIDKRAKYKIDLQFTSPPSEELIASAEPAKKSITEYANDQWEALSGLKFKDLEDPRGKVSLPKIDREKLTLDNLFNRNKQ